MRKRIFELSGPVLALAAVAALALVPASAGKPKPPKPPPKPQPKIELLSKTEQGVLRRRAVKVEVRSRRGREARVTAAFTVDGYPDDYHFRLGPKQKRLRGNDATFRLGLSARKREVLDFAIKTCRGASLEITAKVGRGVGREFENLKRPSECRPG